jgi:hypothetical protein
MSADFLSFLPESFRDLLVTLVNRYPSLKPILDNWRLGLALCLVLAEGISLSRHSASISERFFGLRRTAKTRSIETVRFFSLIETALLPCVPPENDVAKGYRGLSSLYRLLYLLGYTSFFSPIQHIAGIRLSPRGSADGGVSKMGRAMYAVQLFQWISANRNLLQPLRRTAVLKTLAPPENPVSLPHEKTRASRRVPLPVDPSLCPICQQTRKNPTAVVSGYVFCFACINRWKNDLGEFCPVSGKPINELRRLY